MKSGGSATTKKIVVCVFEKGSSRNHRMGRDQRGATALENLFHALFAYIF